MYLQIDNVGVPQLSEQGDLEAQRYQLLGAKRRSFYDLDGKTQPRGSLTAHLHATRLSHTKDDVVAALVPLDLVLLFKALGVGRQSIGGVGLEYGPPSRLARPCDGE